MTEAFFIRALLAGIGVALVAGPFGCFIVWRRLAYFGDTLAHASLLGIALALLLGLNLPLTVFAVAAAIAGLLAWIGRRAALGSDALLGVLAHGALAAGLVALSLVTWVRTDLMGLLFGDILAVTSADLAVIWLGGAAALAALAHAWRPLFAATVDRDIAQAEGLATGRAEILFLFTLAALIALAMKAVGILLVTAMLVVPAAAARRLAATPEAMAAFAAAIGAIAAVAGLFASLKFDTPSGPSIVVGAVVLFVLSLSPGAARIGALFGKPRESGR
jgi:zinc transport system permease protein